MLAGFMVRSVARFAVLVEPYQCDLRVFDKKNSVYAVLSEVSRFTSRFTRPSSGDLRAIDFRSTSPYPLM